MLNFNLPEKLFILAIDDERGAIEASVKSSLPYGLAGGLLADLALANQIQLQDGRLVLTGALPGGDALLNEFLAQAAAEKKLRKIARWINILGDKQAIRKTAERLSARNVIRIEKKRYLWIIPYEVYPQVDASAKYWLKEHLRRIVLTDEKAFTPDIALLSLLKACGMLRFLFTRDERKAASKKVEALVKGEVFGEAVAKLLEEIEAATVAVIAATTAAS